MRVLFAALILRLARSGSTKLILTFVACPVSIVPIEQLESIEIPPFNLRYLLVPDSRGIALVSSPFRLTQVKLLSLTASISHKCTVPMSMSSKSFSFTCLISWLIGGLPRLALGGERSKLSTSVSRSVTQASISVRPTKSAKASDHVRASLLMKQLAEPSTSNPRRLHIPPKLGSSRLKPTMPLTKLTAANVEAQIPKSA